jgi:hypothetical protein
MLLTKEKKRFRRDHIRWRDIAKIYNSPVDLEEIAIVVADNGFPDNNVLDKREVWIKNILNWQKQIAEEIKTKNNMRIDPCFEKWTNEEIDCHVIRKFKLGRTGELNCIEDRLEDVIREELRKDNCPLNVDFIHAVIVSLIYTVDDKDLYKKLHVSEGGEEVHNRFDVSYVRDFCKRMGLEKSQIKKCTRSSKKGTAVVFPNTWDLWKSERDSRILVSKTAYANCPHSVQDLLPMYSVSASQNFVNFSNPGSTLLYDDHNTGSNCKKIDVKNLSEQSVDDEFQMMYSLFATEPIIRNSSPVIVSPPSMEINFCGPPLINLNEMMLAEEFYDDSTYDLAVATSPLSTKLRTTLRRARNLKRQQAKKLLAAEKSVGEQQQQQQQQSVVGEQQQQQSVVGEQQQQQSVVGEQQQSVVGEQQQQSVVGEQQQQSVVGEQQQQQSVVGEQQQQQSVVGEPQQQSVVGEPQQQSVVGEPQQQSVVGEPQTALKQAGGKRKRGVAFSTLTVNHSSQPLLR